MFEEIEGKKKHSVAFTILGIFVILATIGGVAVAAYTWNFASNKANSISTGSISMSLLESVDAIDITDALPMQDSDGKAQGKKFDFSVTTSASGAPGNITYTLSITKLAVDSGYTALPDSSVKVYDVLLKEMNKNLYLNHEYIKLKNKLIGKEKMHMYDVYVNPLSVENENVEYEEAKKIVL